MKEDTRVALPKEMLILAGGLGTRLRSMVKDVPKPMAMIAGKPFLEYLLEHWTGQGIERFVISIGYLGHVIQNYFGDRFFEARVDYVTETSPLGTGGAIQLALSSISWNSGYMAAVNGDTWFPADLQQMLRDAHSQRYPNMLIGIHQVQENRRYSAAELFADGRLKSFGGANGGRQFINAGVYLLEAGSLTRDLQDYSAPFSFEEDFLRSRVRDGRFGSSIQDLPFLDIGVPEDFLQAERYLLK